MGDVPHVHNNRRKVSKQSDWSKEFILKNVGEAVEKIVEVLNLSLELRLNRTSIGIHPRIVSSKVP